jgi:light-independent protochlorophyllide reductase subunit B
LPAWARRISTWCSIPKSPQAARGWSAHFGQTVDQTVPIGVGATRDFIAEVAPLAGLDAAPIWRSKRRGCPGTRARSIRPISPASGSSSLATPPMPSLPPRRREELGFEVVGLGTYSREFAREVRGCRQALRRRAADQRRLSRGRSSDRRLQPELVLGTQMERHIAKRLGIPCAVISARCMCRTSRRAHSPQMGFEGANVLFDTWVHPLMMGLEEHLLACSATISSSTIRPPPSHLGHGAAAPRRPAQATDGLDALQTETGTAVTTIAAPAAAGASPSWAPEAEKELKKIPFFVRGKARATPNASPASTA